jgi:hypothetical protein
MPENVFDREEGKEAFTVINEELVKTLVQNKGFEIVGEIGDNIVEKKEYTLWGFRENLSKRELKGIDENELYQEKSKYRGIYPDERFKKHRRAKKPEYLTKRIGRRKNYVGKFS